MNNVITKIKIESEKDSASPRSNTIEGIGRIIMTMVAISAAATKIAGSIFGNPVKALCRMLGETQAVIA